MSKSLMEDAAAILNASIKNGVSMPPQKLDGEVIDIGGKTVTNKPEDSKLEPTKGMKQAEAPKTKPSAANGKVVDSLTREHVMSDINNIFKEDAALSEEFKEQVALVYEARVNERISAIKSNLEEQYAEILESKVEEIQESLSEQLSSYLDFVVENWVKENEIAIQSSLRSEIVEDFMYAMKNVFKEHYIDIPEDKVNVVEELALRVEELEANLNEQLNINVKLNNALNESKKNEIINSVCEDLTTTQKEKIKSLAENVEFSSEKDFSSRIETLRENYFPSATRKRVSNEQLNEGHTEARTVSDNAYINAIANAIAKSRI